ncbi:DEHA2B16148p [Debaryomyces hansenii CBS767]|uniref:DEHA2B16148p n=1 Tax=Debaryomyces hansenii (strain ATCC 36239 / CBS 767 / BCRC 21394 / JCM 1990 / NBRC 0083 / IGC 2968) TaxID=284592 RepID=Q6BVW6_DEBHA|nr:DEHA2B16148p [Debaryomyces hansenii CBS767]CAG85667.2 DEHA2B16148p [Debaryomyces hansenii CBS767]|eukprot:XP_457653.2 DEHA2B16148p [Debaryomyces hansenii CBS767]
MANMPITMTNKFECDFPGCHKSFSRKDHLRRHHLNHDDNAVLHGCSYPGCKMEFKRYDVMIGHYERHFKKRKVLNKDQVAYGSESNLRQNQTSPAIERQDDISEKDNVFMQAGFMDILFDLNELVPEDRTEQNPSKLNNIHKNTAQNIIYSEFPSTLMFKNYPDAILLEIFNGDFETLSISQTSSSLLTSEMLKTLLHLVPNLVQFPDFNIPTFEYCLEVYWSVFHIQFPILHRASFNTSTAHPLLVVAMIMIGSVLSYSARDILKDPTGLSLTIGTDLRWLIFKSRKYGPSQLWELQSLLILEVYEKYFANRDLFERSSIHHAAKVEMIKRSTSLIGEPYVSETRSTIKSKENDGERLWNKWIAAESMKRCTLMSFCSDLTSSMISSHNSSLFVDKLTLALPCNDLLWEASFENLKSFTLPAKSDSIRDCLKKLLKGENIKADSFGKKILFHTLASLIIQLENKDEIVSLIGNIGYDSLKDRWRDKISFALDAWKYNVNGACSDVKNLLIDSPTLESSILNPLYLHLDDTKCKCPTYHMAQIRLHVINNDVLVYSGVPVSMNSRSSNEECQNVSIRMKRWADSLNGRIGVVHAYLCLIECLLSVDKISYLPRIDPIPERRHVMVVCSLTIWCYNYIVYGPESNQYLSEDKYSFKESAFHYLNKLKDKFCSIIIPSQNAIEFHLNVRKCAINLPQFENTHYIAGFMNEMSQLFDACSWSLGREYSRSFKVCEERSLGREEIFCNDMYKDE